MLTDFLIARCGFLATRQDSEHRKIVIASFEATKKKTAKCLTVLSLKKKTVLNWHKDNFTISTDKTRLNIEYIHEYLSNRSYWAENIPIHVVQKSIEGSICFGIFIEKKQIGFARVITDMASFGYLADVFVDENYRGLGLSKWLMEVILSYPDLQGLRRFLLATRDAHGLYEQFGFSVLSFPEKWMHIHNPDVYKKNQ